MSKFEVGQRVKITTNHRTANGKEGIITEIDPSLEDGMIYIVDFPGATRGYIWNFCEAELDAISELAPATPAADAPQRDAGGADVPYMTFNEHLELSNLAQCIRDNGGGSVWFGGYDIGRDVIDAYVKKGILEYEQGGKAVKPGARFWDDPDDAKPAQPAANGMTAHELYIQADARAAALEAENARLRAALLFCDTSLAAIECYVEEPSAVNATDMTVEEKMHGMLSQALAAHDVVEDALAAQRDGGG